MGFFSGKKHFHKKSGGFLKSHMKFFYRIMKLIDFVDNVISLAFAISVFSASYLVSDGGTHLQFVLYVVGVTGYLMLYKKLMDISDEIRKERKYVESIEQFIFRKDMKEMIEDAS